MALARSFGTSMGFGKGNNELLTNCHAKVPDDASMVIIKAAWQKARTK